MNKHYFFRLVLLLLTAGGLCSQTSSQAQTIRFVRANGTNTNPATATTWATATTNLQGAISASGGNDQVWVAAGTYKPGGNANTDRTARFVLQSGVSVYGGFLGTETNVSQRPAMNTNLGAPSSTTLSGEIGDPTSTTDNSFHVLVSVDVPNAILDGFVITGGRADGTADVDKQGGGIANFTSTLNSMLLRDCLFTKNYAVGKGGAVSNFGFNSISHSLTITRCAFVDNSTGGSGGAISSLPGPSLPAGSVTYALTVADTRFERNIASAGGAIYHDGTNQPGAPVSIARCNFTQNTSQIQGGALYVQAAAPTVVSSVFVNNTAGLGGALYTYNSTLALTNCSFRSNIALAGGFAGQTHEICR